MKIKSWTPFFDEKWEKTFIKPIWIFLPRLPPELWSKDIFKLVGVAIGNFLDVDIRFVDSCIMNLAHILVDVDTRDKLVAKMTIRKGTSSMVQPLDYVGIPF